MDFHFSEQQRLLQSSVRQLAREKLAPIAHEVDEMNCVSQEVVGILKQAALFDLVVPPAYGGVGISAVSICIVREELSRESTHADSVFAMNGIGSYPIVTAGTESQKLRYLCPIGKGEMIAAFALTEPDAGSDVGAIKTTAVLEGNQYVLNGTKTLITNAGDAGIYVVFAKTDPGLGSKGISAFLVNEGTPGFRTTRRLELIAPHPIGELEMNDCRIPQQNILGQPGEGFAIAMRNLDMYRASVGASAVGMGQAGLDAAVRYAKGRPAFGKTLADLQGIQFKLADMATALDAARLLVYRAACLRDEGVQETAKVASMAKLFATETAHRVVDQALQIHGGIGLVKNLHIVERLYRAVRASRIYEGANEVQRVVIARQVLKEDHG